jgi:Cdc6-like AAA superfamily ATPase
MRLACRQHQSLNFFSLSRFFADVLSGYNGTIFAYGQTSSGKTHTMEVRFNAHWKKSSFQQFFSGEDQLSRVQLSANER